MFICVFSPFFEVFPQL